MLKYSLIAILISALVVMHVLKNKLSNHNLFIFKTILIIALLEVTVFNINAYRADFGNGKYLQFSGDDLTKITSMTLENTQYISIDELHTKVKSIYLQLDGLEQNQVVDYDIYYADQSTSKRYLASKNYCESVKKTKYSVVSLSRRL